MATTLTCRVPSSALKGFGLQPPGSAASMALQTLFPVLFLLSSPYLVPWGPLLPTMATKPWAPSGSHISSPCPHSDPTPRFLASRSHWPCLSTSVSL